MLRRWCQRAAETAGSERSHRRKRSGCQPLTQRGQRAQVPERPEPQPQEPRRQKPVRRGPESPGRRSVLVRSWPRGPVPPTGKRSAASVRAGTHVSLAGSAARGTRPIAPSGTTNTRVASRRCAPIGSQIICRRSIASTAVLQHRGFGIAARKQACPAGFEAKRRDALLDVRHRAQWYQRHALLAAAQDEGRNRRRFARCHADGRAARAAVELHERHQHRAGWQCATDFVEAHRHPRDLGSFRRALFSEGAFGVFLLLPGLVHQRSRDRLIEAANQQVGVPLPGLLGTLGGCRHLRAGSPKRVGTSGQLVEDEPA